MKPIKILGSALIILGVYVFITGISAQAKSARLPEAVAEAVIDKLKSEDPAERLQAFNALGVTEPSMMSLILDAVRPTPCGIEDLERFILSEQITSIVDVLKKRRSKLENSEKIAKECELIMQGSAQYGF
ncbi:MAG: hypothetical protein ACRBBN_19630 [Methyloligellaceae bacterium]